MIYNAELVEKVSYGSEFGQCGVIEEIDVREKYVETVMRINFTEGEHGLLVNAEDANYILCGHGLFSVSDAIINPGDYVQVADGYAKVIEEGSYDDDTKMFTVDTNSNAVKVQLDNGQTALIVKSNMEGRHRFINLYSGEITAIESEIVFDSAEKAVKMYTHEMSSEVFTGSMFDFDEWE